MSQLSLFRSRSESPQKLGTMIDGSHFSQLDKWGEYDWFDKENITVYPFESRKSRYEYSIGDVILVYTGDFEYTKVTVVLDTVELSRVEEEIQDEFDMGEFEDGFCLVVSPFWDVHIDSKYFADVVGESVGWLVGFEKMRDESKKEGIRDEFGGFDSFEHSVLEMIAEHSKEDIGVQILEDVLSRHDAGNTLI